MKTAAIAHSSSGANEIVAAVPGQKIRVFAAQLSFSGTVNAKWQSASTDLTGLTYGVANVHAELPMAPPVAGHRAPYFETAPGEALNLNLSGGVAVGGFVCYETARA